MVNVVDNGNVMSDYYSVLIEGSHFFLDEEVGNCGFFTRLIVSAGQDDFREQCIVAAQEKISELNLIPRTSGILKSCCLVERILLLDERPDPVDFAGATLYPVTIKDTLVSTLKRLAVGWFSPNRIVYLAGSKL